MTPAPVATADGGPTAQPQVLIVGAGPSGLTAAVVLATLGVRARVIDADCGPTEQSRALVVQARTLELWNTLGVAGRALAEGKVVTGAVAYSNGRLLNHGCSLLNFAALGAGQTPYPFLLVLEQSATQRLLLDTLHHLGGTVHWGVQAHSLHQHHGQVEVTLRHRSGHQLAQTAETIQPSWVIGADGASSATRHALGVGFDGGSYEQAFFLADVAMTWGHPPTALYLALTNTGTFLFVPMPTESGKTPRYRVLGSVTPDMASRDPLTITEVQTAIDHHAGVAAAVSDAKWVSLYRLHHRMAHRFRAHRVFLIGDAAHVHSPVGGQGMNTGIQDAYNLAWKLALVIGGQANETLLDTYGAERMPVARRLLNGTDKTFNVLVSDRKLVRTARSIGARLLPFALRHATPTTQRLFATVSQIGITYATSDLARRQDRLGRPHSGDRAPHADFITGPRAGMSILNLLTGAQHHLLLLDRSTPVVQIPESVKNIIANQSVTLKVHLIAARETLIHDAYGVEEPTVVLVRPDGYIAWRGAVSDTDGLAAYLSHWYQPAPTN
ncbi:hypothetical protein F0Q45_13900 [Mycobacterium simiae]|uniref:FAD-binding domain-containing protein n=1 Tax=Mycobacterium simiae TaxID=1784 RepID=A0A5B1BNJ8_MYCSI|nr:FAD-dependent monooxygenase [Mycobacterium simiae]KAA1249671.1 hypothetical protein F0Q45_13900 [Mycobacterium simiae]